MLKGFIDLGALHISFNTVNDTTDVHVRNTTTGKVHSYVLRTDLLARDLKMALHIDNITSKDAGIICKVLDSVMDDLPHYLRMQAN